MHKNATSISNTAFSGCRSLTSITLPTTVTTIGTYAFNGCAVLTSVTFQDASTTIANVNSFPNDLKTFYDAQSTKSGTYVLNDEAWSKSS